VCRIALHVLSAVCVAAVVMAKGMKANKAKAMSKVGGVKVDKVKKAEKLKKVRIGIVVGKDFDPVKKDTHWPQFPREFNLTREEWGKYSVDAATALRMQQLHPDLLEIDIIAGKQLTQKRLKKNHVNVNFWYEIGVSLMTGDKKHITEVTKCLNNPDCRLDPSGDYYDWIMRKPRYMKQCMKAGIPMIPTVFYENGFNPTQCMKDIQKQGWDNFFVKVGSFAYFGAGAINGKTEDFLGLRVKDLDNYAKENKKSKIFLCQPYMLKPNGQVFDEVRNFFIHGEWRYSIFTHGTNGDNSGYYHEPDGPRKDACRCLAERAYKEVLKTATWQGKRQTPLLNRIDIGVIPKKHSNEWVTIGGRRVVGGDSLDKTDNHYFVNEIEMICTTWLDRYAPISVQDVMAQATVKYSMELLVGLLKAKRHVPDEAHVRKAIIALNQRLGPFKHIKI